MKRTQSPIFWKTLFWVLALSILTTMLLISKDYGLNTDEPIHQLHGELILKHFTEGDSTAGLSPFDNEGQLIHTFDAIPDERIRGMNFFGGSFDLLVNALYPAFDHLGIYDFRHLINALIGFLCLLFIALLAKELSNWKWAVLALLFAVLTPRIFGHSFTNPKDIPFAFTYIAGLYYNLRFIRRLPRISFYDAIMLALIIGIAISIRVSGLLLIAYAGLFHLIYYFPALRSNFKKGFKTQLMPMLVLALVLLAGYFSTALYWPYMRNDLLAPVKVLTTVSDFKVFHTYELLNGKWISSHNVPFSYVPTWVLITLPLFSLTGAIVSFGSLFKADIKEYKNFAIAALFFSALFPVVYFISTGANIYNGIRHLLFIFPPLIVVSVLGWKHLFQTYKHSALRYTLIAFLVITMAEAGFWTIKSHPYQAMYFSPLAGGAKHAPGQFELDYWGISTKEAIEWIDENTPDKSVQNPVKIKMFYGDRDKVTYYTDSIDGLEYFVGNAKVGWDYEIIFISQAKFNRTEEFSWPPERTVYEVKAHNTPLCAVVRSSELKEIISDLKQNAVSIEDFINLSLSLYNAGDYIDCVNEAKRGLQYFPNNPTLHNNIGAAYNALELYRIAKRFLEKASELDPTSKNTRANLKHSQNADPHLDKADFLLNASLNAYLTSEFEDCVWYAEKCLINNPESAVAYNNICSAYNQLGRFAQAEKACLKALALNPDMTLAKNNLKYTQRMLKGSADKK